MATKKKLLQAAAGQAGGEALNVEDVFSTYLYTGTGSTLNIVNGIDLDGEGGMVWHKYRGGTSDHGVFDTERGVSRKLTPNETDAQTAAFSGAGITAFNSNGYTLGTQFSGENGSGNEVASWTFRKAPKFFDVVTYTGDGTAGRTVSHNLGSVPGCIIVKVTSAGGNWVVYHRGTDATAPEDYGLKLSASFAREDNVVFWNDTAPTSTEFTVGTGSLVNQNGASYVAYLFAHNDDDGEFGPDGDADIIKCGSVTYTTGATVDLGFEPQWVLVKPSSSTGNWILNDVMRGMPNGSRGPRLDADGSGAEIANATVVYPTSTGFIMPSGLYTNSTDLIYIAIRRGPMAVPESATDVFAMDYYSSGTPEHTSNFPVDMAYWDAPTFNWNQEVHTRILGTKVLKTHLTAAEATRSDLKWDNMDGYSAYPYSYSQLAWMWRRAPNYFDVVAYTGTGNNSTRMVDHNLTVKPEMVWVKRRDDLSSWFVTTESLGVNNYLMLDSSGTGATYTNMGAHTATQFSARGLDATNGTFIAYLFASLDGVSKVGSYTGNGTSQNIDCGFSSGARFVLVKRSDAISNWVLWDSERGIVAGNDPFLLLNATSAQNSSYDSIDPYSGGFAMNETANNLNVSGGTYIFYAIA